MGFFQRAWEVLTRRIDSMLFGCALAIVGVGLVTLFSEADQSIARVTSQAMSLSFAVVLMWMFANIAPQTLARAAVPRGAAVPRPVARRVPHVLRTHGAPGWFEPERKPTRSA